MFSAGSRRSQSMRPFAFEGVEGAVDVLDAAFEWRAAVFVEAGGFGVVVADLVEQLVDALRVFDRAGEGDCTAHRCGVRLEGVFGQAALGESVPAADDLCGVVQL